MNSFWNKNKNFIFDNFFKLNHDSLKVYKVVLNPGNSLLIPPWWFHSVKGHGFSVSITKTYNRSNLNYLNKYKYLYFLDNLDYYYDILLFMCRLILIILIIIIIKKLNKK